MQHTIPLEQLGASGQVMAHAIETCVHCGFCLPTCPTYQQLGEEMDSPRGRIVLMKSALEGALELETTLPHIDRCLGCLGCVTACPSGVPYGDLITTYRAHTETRRTRAWDERLGRWLIRQTLPYPQRFRIAATLGRWGKPLINTLPRDWWPRPLAAMLTLLPEQLATDSPLPAVYPAQGTRRARVALLIGCVQSVLRPNLHWATLRVLARNGVEVVIPPQQGCCGALSAHIGEAPLARQFAARNFQHFPTDVDAIITTAAGCGSGIHEYPLWFADQPQLSMAQLWAQKTRDVSVFLNALGIISPPPLMDPLTVAYHDACHLAHAQSVTEAPRRLLHHIPNLTVRDIPEGDICCGSAGVYNIEQPDIAGQLGRRKAEAIVRTQAEAVAAGNIGCLVQIETHLRALGHPLPIYHTIEVLDQAYHPENACHT